jgi:hypothetical protein
MELPVPSTVSKYQPSYFTPKIKFKPDKDDLLRSLVARFEAGDWRLIANHISPRSSWQCRERWKNYLDPHIKPRDVWTAEEDSLIESSFAKIRSRWTTLAAIFPGRSTNNVKNRFVLQIGTP